MQTDRRHREVRRARRRRRGAILLGFVAVAALSGYGLAAARVFRAPYPDAARRLAGWIGLPEKAANFAVVDPGHVFRSARPDAALLEHVRRRHGVVRVISLSGDDDAAVARAMGFDVRVYRWLSGAWPPEHELKEVQSLLDEAAPTLVHCHSGSDRTGCAVAAFRLRRGANLADVVSDMVRFGHRPERYPDVHRRLALYERDVRARSTPAGRVAAAADLAD
jgi:hypothetical protein